jgi:hypothetical protein
MEKLKQFFQAATWAAAFLFIISLALAVHQVMPQVRGEVTDLNRVTLSIGGTAAELRKSSKAWELASQQSQQMTAQTAVILENLSSTTKTLNDAAASLTAMIQHTDDSVNVRLIPQLGKTIEDNDARLSQLVTDTDQTVIAMGATSKSAAETMAQATSTLATAGKVLGDPAIPAILAYTQTASKNVASTTGHIDAASADIQVKVHQMTRPASFIKRVLEATLTLAAPVVSIFK